MYCKFVIFWVVIGLSEDFIVRAPNIALRISLVRLAKNDDLDASNIILQFGHLFSSYGVK